MHNEIPFNLEQNFTIPEITRNQALSELVASRELLGLGGDQYQRESDIMDSGSGSDSDPTQDNLDETELERLIPAAHIKNIPGCAKREKDTD